MQTSCITALAPAKLNLFLHVTGRRPDGYHLIQSVFMLIDWCDTLHFELRQDGLITREDVLNTTGKPLPEMDLSVRAALALQAAARSPSRGGGGFGDRSGDRFGNSLAQRGAHIRLEKRIPSEAGMGGGSSDAAATLLALNTLWQLDFSLPELAAIGVTLGADVPFFVYKNHAWVEGIGEQITPIQLPQSLENTRFLVVKPAHGVSTPAVFSSELLARDTKTATIAGFAAWTESHTQQQCLSLFGCNDLQPVAEGLCPDITQALDWLAALGLNPRMTGSGSAVFAQVPDSFDLNAAISFPAGWHYKLCSNTMNLSFTPSFTP
jgi:4-diphosphocytidyl-2-C-methyl-D-erythritol kinase